MDKYQLLLIPILTAGLTTLFIFLRESRLFIFQEIKKQRRKLVEEQLTHLYNKLFVYYIESYGALKADYYESEVWEDEGDIFKLMEPRIENIEEWNKVTNEVTQLVHSKIHLLTYDDLSLWFSLGKPWVIDSERDLVDYYKSFKLFIKQSTKTYGLLYHEYHKTDKRRPNPHAPQRQKQP